jgi:hypothetical protein
MAHMCGGLDHHLGDYTDQQRADLDVVLAFNRRMSDAINEGLDTQETEAFLDPDPLRYMWVDEGKGRISRVIGEAHELLARATHLPGHQRRGVRVVEGSTRAARPSIATSADWGARLTVWVEWVPGEGDVVQALYEEQGRAASLTVVSGGCSDVFRPTAAISSEGVPWVFYGSSNPKRVGVWANTLLEGRWSEPHQVSTTEHPSFNQEVLARSDGSLELCWQGRHSGRFAVFTRRHAEGAWGPRRWPRPLR